MPQLSTIYIFTIFLWIWLVLTIITQKTKTTLTNKTIITSPSTNPKKPTMALPWT